MEKINKTSILENSRIKLTEIIRKNRLYDVDVSVLVKTLTPEEAIGEPGRRDFPIIIGKERVIEAKLLTAKAHAFTDFPVEFKGSLRKMLDIPTTSNKDRAIYIAVLNAVLKHLNIAEKTLHCKDDKPGKCAEEIASQLLEKWGKIKVGLIGLNPAIAELLVDTFGVRNVKITDLYKKNINSLKYGIRIWNGNKMTAKLVKQSDLILITGTTLVNGTFERIMNYVRKYKKDYLIYGVTGAGICKLMELNRICPYGRN